MTESLVKKTILSALLPRRTFLTSGTEGISSFSQRFAAVEERRFSSPRAIDDSSGGWRQRPRVKHASVFCSRTEKQVG